jgi:hypothetical protein
MLEFIVVERPVAWPNACVLCMGINGPVADTHRELPQFGHVYVCQNCAKRLARQFGFVKGKRMDELAEASDLLNTAKLDIIARDATIQKFTEDLVAANAKIDAVHEDNDFLAGRIKQLEGRLEQNAKAALELVGHAESA